MPYPSLPTHRVQHSCSCYPLFHLLHVAVFLTFTLYCLLFSICPIFCNANMSEDNPKPNSCSFHYIPVPQSSVCPSLNRLYSSHLSTFGSFSEFFLFTSKCAKKKNRFRLLFVLAILTLCGDIELNPGPPSFACLNIRPTASVASHIDKPTVLRD